MRANCAQCHSIDKISASPLKIAPPFRTLHLQYPVESLAEAWLKASQQAIRACRNFSLIPVRSAT